VLARAELGKRACACASASASASAGAGAGAWFHQWPSVLGFDHWHH